MVPTGAIALTEKSPKLLFGGCSKHKMYTKHGVPLSVLAEMNTKM